MSVALPAEPAQMDDAGRSLRPIDLVFLPGLDGTGVTFQPIIKLLPSHVRATVIVYPPDQVLSYPELIAYVTARLPDRPFVLLGESFGSPLAIKLAASRPRGLHGLILSAAFARNPLMTRPNWLAHFAQPLLFHVYKPYVRLKVRRRRDETYAAMRLPALTRETPGVIANRVRCALRVDASEELSTCDVPVLSIRGKRDRIVPRHNQLHLARCLAAMQVEELDGGHCLLRSRPQSALPILVDFIERCAAAEPATSLQVN